MLKSKYSIPKNIDKLIDELPISLDSNYIKFMREYNVVCFNNEFGITSTDGFLPIECLLGFSRKTEEDLLSVAKNYANRIPSGYMAIASVNFGDFLCIDKAGGIYLWDHEINDLYFNNDNDYQEQNLALKKIYNEFNELIDNIIKDEEEIVDESPDEFLDHNKPFPDDTLKIYFLKPKLFFMEPSHILEIYIKKLNLSIKGRELLDKFRLEGLL